MGGEPVYRPLCRSSGVLTRGDSVGVRTKGKWRQSLWHNHGSRFAQARQRLSHSESFICTVSYMFGSLFNVSALWTLIDPSILSLKLKYFACFYGLRKKTSHGPSWKSYQFSKSVRDYRFILLDCLMSTGSIQPQGLSLACSRCSAITVKLDCKSWVICMSPTTWQTDWEISLMH